MQHSTKLKTLIIKIVLIKDFFLKIKKNYDNYECFPQLRELNKFNNFTFI